MKCSRFACGISSSVFCLISVCSKWKEKQIMRAISYCLFPSDHHKIQQNKNEANTCFARSVCSELRSQGNWQDSGLLRLFPTLVSFPLSDLPYPQKEVLVFSNPHTSQLYLIYDVFILPRPQAVSLSNDWQQLWNEVGPKWPLIGMGCLSSQT